MGYCDAADGANTGQEQPTIRLAGALAAWGTPRFREILKIEIEQLEAHRLPLQDGLAKGSHALDEPHQAMIIGISEQDDVIRAKVGLFYSSIIAGCSCADDPTPIDTLSEYCEVQVDIDKQTAATTVRLLTE